MLDRSVQQRLEWGGLGLLVVGSALAMGSTHTPVLIAVAVLALAVFVVHVWDAPPFPVRREATVLLAVGAVLITWTFVQQLPLPSWLVATLAPANADVWARCLTPLGEPGPSQVALSLDPSATRVQILRGVVYLLVFVSALRSAGTREGRRVLGFAIVVSAVLVAAAALLHPALGMRRVYGIVSPQSVDFGTRLAPLLNTNHLSAYLDVGSCLALASAIARGSSVVRVTSLGIYLALVGVQIWLASRAGVAAMLLGTATVAWLSRAKSSGGKRVPWAFAALGVLLVSTVALFVLGSGGRALSELTSRDTIKLNLIQRAWEAARTFPIVGMGRGAFESVFPAFRADGEGHLVFTHPENIVLQWGAEWGLPIGVTALIAVAWALRPGAALRRSSVPAGPAAALVAVGAHNMLDFSIEIPAVAIALAICAACVVGGRGEGRARSDAPRWQARPRVLVAVAACVTGLAAAGAATSMGHDLVADEASLRALAIDPDTDRATFAAAAREAMSRHPAAPYLPMMGAVRAARARDESAIPWLARTLERASVYGRAHLLLARQLGRRHAAQARLEYRLAMEQDYNLTGVAVSEGALLVSGPEDGLQLLPGGRLAERVGLGLAATLRARVPAAADRLELELETRFPGSRAVAEAAAEGAVRALAAGGPPCDADREACLARARDRVSHLERLAPRACVGHHLRAELERAAGDGAAELAELEQSAETLDDPLRCLRYVVERARAAGDSDRLERAVHRLLSASCAEPDACAAAHLAAIGVEQQEGRLHGAVRYAKRGHDRFPERLDLLRALAETSAAAGLHAQAVTSYKKLSAREPDNAAWKEALEREREALGRVRHEGLIRD